MMKDFKEFEKLNAEHMTPFKDVNGEFLYPLYTKRLPSGYYSYSHLVNSQHVLKDGEIMGSCDKFLKYRF